MAEAEELCSDLEADDDDGKALKRFPAQHKRVLAVIERKVWHIYGLINLEGKMEAKDVHEILKREQEVERKRRMSEPYGSDKSITDRHIQERKRRLSDLHEDLFKLFAINAAVSQRKFEQQRLVAEANRQLVHEEMLRNSMIKTVKEAVEIERQERIKILEEMANGKRDSYEIADTNAKRSEVHQELKKLFRYVEKSKQNESKENTSIDKEEIKNRIKELSRRKLSRELKEIKQRRLEGDTDLKNTIEYRQIVKRKLREVQQELVAIFEIYKSKAAAMPNREKRGKNLKDLNAVG